VAAKLSGARTHAPDSYSAKRIEKGNETVRRIIFWLIILAILVGAGTAGYNRLYVSNPTLATAKYRTAAVARGGVQQVVNSTGSVKPVRTVQVGSFVSGPIIEVYVDFNDRVTKDQPMAKVDPRLYNAAVSHEKAAYYRCLADVKRIEALLAQAVRNEERGQKLHVTRAISESDMDLYIAEKGSLQAQLEVANAAVLESEASLSTAETNLKFTDILAPVDGIVTDRKIDPGQTVAAQFQTPTLFVVAPDLDKTVYVYASVDEADIGLIRSAEARKQPVTFTVDAYPSDVFQGTIRQIRFNPTTVQNVVTFTVVVEAANPELKLLPDMTANLTFQIERKTDVLLVPNSAFRFFPKPEQVCERDRPLLEAIEADSQWQRKGGPSDRAKERGDPKTPRPDRTHKYVWIAEGDLLAAVPIEIGLSDKTNTEILAGKLTPGQEIITGLAK
jgi:HlyD family secretion protein